MSSRRWIIKDLLDTASGYLKDKGIASPRLNAEILLAHQLKTDRMRLYIEFDSPLGESDITSYRSLIKRLLNREPVQYITGRQEFWSIDFTVNPNVLIPRPETEILVEQALKLIPKDNTGDEETVILDLGTGSGAIAISIAHEAPNARVWASDLSKGALDIALNNAMRHEVKERISFIQGNLFEPFKSNSNKFNIIISNPPYIASSDYENLTPEIRDHEPRMALHGGDDGLFYIKRIIEEAPHYLRPGGWLLIEMDPGQSEPALRITGDIHSYDVKKTVKDYSHKDRVLMVRKTI